MIITWLFATLINTGNAYILGRDKTLTRQNICLQLDTLR